MLKIGSRVRYIHEDTPYEKETGHYPPIGTLGTITDISSICYEVKWDKGTSGYGIWWCHHTDVEPIYDPSINGAIVAIRIFMADNGITPMAELAFAFGGSKTICWVDTNEMQIYQSGINGYTLLYDERPRREFDEWIKPAAK